MHNSTLTVGPTVPSYWLVVKLGSALTEVLTIELVDGERVLPVFSHREEALPFLRFGRRRDVWQARETTAGELVSVLYGPCASIRRVALDPSPGPDVETTIGLASVDRREFVGLVMGERVDIVPRPVGTSRSEAV